MSYGLASLKALDEILDGIGTHDEQSVAVYADRLRTVVIASKHLLQAHYRNSANSSDQAQADSIISSSLGKVCVLLEAMSEGSSYYCCEEDSEDCLSHHNVTNKGVVLPLPPQNSEPVELGCGDDTAAVSAVTDQPEQPHSPTAIGCSSDVRHGKWMSTVEPQSPSSSRNAATSSVDPEEDTEVTTDAPLYRTKIEEDWARETSELGDFEISHTTQLGSRVVNLVNDHYYSDAGTQEVASSHGKE